jgi:hypothetical protein
VLGLDSCVTKAKWKNGKREKQEILWIFFPFSQLSPFSFDKLRTSSSAA